VAYCSAVNYVDVIVWMHGMTLAYGPGVVPPGWWVDQIYTQLLSVGHNLQQYMQY
jgi:hypothetical protein